MFNFSDISIESMGSNKLDTAYDSMPICNNRGTYDKEKINSLGFRSDEFTTTHEDTHILFAGCSYTFGTGVLLEESWAKLTYRKISSNKKLSGFFNLGSPGESIYACIINMFKYFNNFGNPDVIFFNMPDIKRFYFYSNKKGGLYRIHTKESKVLDLLAYQYYYMLEQYCKSNDIKLLSFTWYLGHDNHCLKGFDSFYSIDIDDISDYVIEYDEKSSDPFSLKSRDGRHLGAAYHSYWSDFIYDRYSLWYNELCLKK